MANTSHIFGFRPSRYLGASPYNGETELYAFSASDATAAFKGDVCQIDDTHRSTALADVYAPGIPFVKQSSGALTTTKFRGVIAGFEPQPQFSQSATASLGTMYRLASTARYAWVVDDYMTVFEVEESGTNSYTTAASNAINQLIEYAPGSGNTSTGVSGATVLGTTIATTNLPFRVLRLTQKPDNWKSLATDTAPFWHWDVMMANCDLATVLVGL